MSHYFRAHQQKHYPHAGEKIARIMRTVKATPCPGPNGTPDKGPCPYWDTCRHRYGEPAHKMCEYGLSGK